MNLDHARALAVSMRPLDVAEIWFARGGPQLPALEEALKLSIEAHAAYIGNTLLCCFGVGALSMMSERGVPWLLATPEFDKHPTIVGRWSQRWVNRLSSRYALLVNYVWADHLVSVPWLEWLGFELGPREPRGPYGKDFRRFEMKGGPILV